MKANGILPKAQFPKPLALVFVAALVAGTACTHNETAAADTTSGIRREAKSQNLNFSSGIRAIFRDSHGRMWFGSMNEGAAMRDETGVTYFGAAEGLTDDQVIAIQEDRDGTLWFDTQKGVYSFDGQRFTNRLAADEMEFYGTKKVSEGQWQRTGGDLWFGAGIREGVYRFDGKQMHYHGFPNPLGKGAFNQYAVTDIAHGANRQLWFATFAGVFGYDGTALTVLNDSTLAHLGLDAPVHIRSIFEDSKGRVWIGNNGLGLLLMDGKTITHFSEAMGLIHPGSSLRGDASPAGTLEHVFTIAEDRYGTLWFGDRDTGLWSYDGERMTNYGAADGLPNAFAMAIYLDPDGMLWLGMADGHVFTYDGKRFEPQFAAQ